MGESEETRGVSDIRDHAKRYEMNLSRRLRGEREREMQSASEYLLQNWSV